MYPLVDHILQKEIIYRNKLQYKGKAKHVVSSSVTY